MYRSLNYDHGKNLTRHKGLAARTSLAVYFCDPHRPWQRGNCEEVSCIRSCPSGGFN